MLTHLPAREGAPSNEPIEGASEHPMRSLTRELARQGEVWTPEVAARVRDGFDHLAGEWHTRITPGRINGVVDAFERGLAGRDPGRVCLELGSGTGFATPWLAARFPVVLAVDLSAEMLARAPTESGFRVRADAARLPLRTGSIDTAVLVNMLLFSAELARVLRGSGALVWVNTSGEGTPIHLDAREVVAALPGAWSGFASRAGTATWAVLHRA